MKLKIYVDGSFDTYDANPMTGEKWVHGGLVIIEDTGTKYIHVTSTSSKLTSMRNVGGEVLAAWIALQYATFYFKDKDLPLGESKELIITYDYEGVGKWALGDWKAKKPGALWYRNIVRELKLANPDIHITYEWVPGHSFDEGNNLADSVAGYDMSYVKLHNIPIMEFNDI